MLRLTQSLTAWNSSNFGSTLKTELEACDANQLPLEKGTSQGGYIGEDNFTVTVNRFSETDSALEGSVGVFLPRSLSTVAAELSQCPSMPIVSYAYQ